MSLNLRHNAIAFGFLLWMIIGSSARIDTLAGLFFLGFFGSLAFAYGVRKLSRMDILGGGLGLLLALLWAIKNPLEPQQIIILVVEMFAWFLILSRVGNISPVHLGYWIAIYCITQLLWKVGIAGTGLLHRDNSLLNGPIKYGMISAIGYSVLLFRERTTRNPKPFELTVLILMLLAIMSSLSRMPIAFTFIVTIWYLVRYSTLTLKGLSFVGFAIAWGFLRETRMLAVNQSGNSLAERILAARYIAWTDALHVFRQNPTLGAGGDIYRDQNYVGLDYPHNLFLEILVNAGIFGLVIFVALFLGQFRKWTSINFGFFAVGMTSGNFFLWMKCMFPYQLSSDKISSEAEKRKQ